MCGICSVCVCVLWWKDGRERGREGGVERETHTRLRYARSGECVCGREGGREGGREEGVEYEATGAARNGELFRFYRRKKMKEEAEQDTTNDTLLLSVEGGKERGRRRRSHTSNNNIEM